MNISPFSSFILPERDISKKQTTLRGEENSMPDSDQVQFDSNDA